MEISHVHKILVGISDDRRPLGRPTRESEDNIKMNVKKIGYGCKNWLAVAQDWGFFVNTVMAVLVP
jgi:hypothetical protein